MGKRTYARIFIAVLLAVLGSTTSAQSLRDIERYIEKSLDRIWYFDSLGYDFIDSQFAANEQLRQYLLSTLPLVPSSISAKLNVPYSMIVATSADNKIRQWAWNTWLGGTWPHYEMLLEYQTANGTVVIDPNENFDRDGEGNNGFWIDTIYMVRTKSGKTVYLPVFQHKFSTSSAAQSIEAWMIEGNKLNRSVEFFKTPQKMLSSIFVEYNYFSNYDYEEGGQRNVIRLSPDGKTLMIPLVEEEKFEEGPIEYVVQKGSLKYEFDGGRFVYKGTSK